jgi:antitoxin (DNA-binding transcriptional repressor) of toxin-antitoxin stability system
MRQVTVHAAKTQLSRLIEAALSGEEIVIAKGDKPVVRLVPIRRGRFKLGVLPHDALGEGPISWRLWMKKSFGRGRGAADGYSMLDTHVWAW